MERKYANIVFLPTWKENTAIAGRFKLFMYPPLFVMQYQMPPGMPNTSRVKHIRRNLSPCLLKLPGELLDARNCLQLAGALLQNRPETFSETGLCAVPRSDISHPEKEQVVATPVLRLFGCARGIFIGHEYSLLAYGKIVRVVASHHNHSHVSHVWWTG